MVWLGRRIGGMVRSGLSHSLGALNLVTLGLAGKVAGMGINHMNNNAGKIGKAARGFGYATLNQRQRNDLSSVADTAIRYMPKGKMKNTLKKINDAAQQRGRYRVEGNKTMKY